MEAERQVALTDVRQTVRSEDNKLNVLPGTKGTSWPWASLSRTMMTRGVAPDHVPRILMFTVLASLGVNLGEKRYEMQQVSAEFSSFAGITQKMYVGFIAQKAVKCHILTTLHIPSHFFLAFLKPY